MVDYYMNSIGQEIHQISNQLKVINLQQRMVVAHLDHILEERRPHQTMAIRDNSVIHRSIEAVAGPAQVKLTPGTVRILTGPMRITTGPTCQIKVGDRVSIINHVEDQQDNIVVTKTSYRIIGSNS